MEVCIAFITLHYRELGEVLDFGNVKETRQENMF